MTFCAVAAAIAPTSTEPSTAPTETELFGSESRQRGTMSGEPRSELHTSTVQQIPSRRTNLGLSASGQEGQQDGGKQDKFAHGGVGGLTCLNRLPAHTTNDQRAQGHTRPLAHSTSNQLLDHSSASLQLSGATPRLTAVGGKSRMDWNGKLRLESTSSLDKENSASRPTACLGKASRRPQVRARLPR